MLRSDSLAGIALVVAVAAFFAPALFGDRAIVPWNMDLWHPWAAHASPEDLARPTRVADSVRQFMVMRHHATESFGDGQVPLWNRWIFCGTPFLANWQPAVFYPPNVLLSISGWPVADQMTAFLAFHFFVATVGMYALLRAFGLSPVAALFGAVAFGWGGHIGSRTGNQTMVSTASWLPWTLWASVRFFRAGRDANGTPAAGGSAAGSAAGSWAGMGAFLGLCGLAGFAQTWVFAVYVWAGFGLLLGLTSQPFPSGRRWAAWALAGVAGIAIAAVHLLPTWEFIQRATDARNTPEMLASGTLHPWTLGKLVVADLLGHPVDHSNATHFLKVGSGFYHQTERSTAVYMGILPLLLAGAVLISPGDRRRAAFFGLVLGIGGLLFCFDGPLRQLVSLLPGMTFSRPDRATVIWSFGLAITSAIGLERLAGPEGPGWRRYANGFAAFLGAVALAFAGLVTLAGQRLLPDEIAGHLGRDAILHAGLVGVAAAGISLALFALRAGGKLGGRAFALIALAVLALDVGLYASRMNVMQPKAALFREPVPGGAIAFLKERAEGAAPFRIFRWEPSRSQFAGALPPSTPWWYRIEDALGFDSINLARYEDLMRAIDPEIVVKRANFRGPRRADVFDSPLLDLLNVRYVVAGQPGALPGLERVHISDLAIHENADVLPRAFLVGEVQVEPDPVHLVAALADRGFRPDLRALSEVPIQGVREAASDGQSARPGATPSGRSEGPAPGTARIALYEDHEVRVEVAPERPALLVLTDSWYPGWKAFVDGAERPIHRVDHLFRGVVVRPGDGSVEFRYRPGSFRAGAAVTLMAAAFLSGGWLVGTRAGRRRRASAGS